MLHGNVLTMTNDEEAVLRKAVIENPDDDAPRLAYADWCDKRGDPRGRFIRVQLELAPIEYDQNSPNRRPLGNESRRLLDKHGHEWMPSQDPHILSCDMHRGFVAGIDITAASFLSHFADISALYPIQYVNIINLIPHAHAVLTSSLLRRLTSLTVSEGDITDDDIKAFAQNQFAQNIWWLVLSDNHITQVGVEALITSPFLTKLSFVALDGNPCDPVEKAGYDQSVLCYKHMPELGRKLIERYGPIKWLYCNDDRFGPYDVVSQRS